MNDFLDSAALMKHVWELSEVIGPRPVGGPQEAQARDYIRSQLKANGFADEDFEEQTFMASKSWGDLYFVSILISLAGNMLGAFGRLGQFFGGLSGLLSAYHVSESIRGRRQPLRRLYSNTATANLIVRIPASQETHQRIVLIGHIDTNKARPSFAPSQKHLIPLLTTTSAVIPLVNGLALLGRSLGAPKAAKTLQWISLGGILYTLAKIWSEETDGFVNGANDNASAVACLLGLGSHLKKNPLEHTEVWLAFTGAEESGCMGMHALLDRYGPQLTNAWFLDFEMVGCKRVVYVTRHGVTPGGGYTPDAESLAWAEETSKRHPELGVTGAAPVIVEEVGSLRQRGFRGICLAGVGPDGWLENWHQHSDNAHHLHPEGLERAARFALAMLTQLDQR